MKVVYADTSFLVSLYTPDANSPLAAAEMKQAKTVFLLTAFGEVELTNALELRLFRKELDPAQVRQANLAFQSDLAGGVLTLTPLPPAVYTRGKQLARKHTSHLGVRTLDLLHVAAALVLRAEVMYTFDGGQRKLARAEGLSIRPAATLPR